jgi:protein-tyrosine phosphatase
VAAAITDPKNASDMRALKSWVKRGVVHLIGSDGHSLRHRPPRLAEAYRQIENWVGNAAAEQICSSNGLAVLHGHQLYCPAPEPVPRRWFAKFW